jgi:transcriptional regulator with XRE-family HTH domain
MAKPGDPADLKLIVMFLRSLRRWTQEELSKESGVDRGLISDYELGNKAPTRPTLERLAAAAGLPYSFIGMLLPIFRAARLAVEGRRAAGGRSEAEAPGNIADGLEQAIVEAVLPGLPPCLMELESLMGEAEDEPAALHPE